MAEYLSPGVYVEEFDSLAPPIEGVGTSTAGLIGMAEKGPIGLPVPLTSMNDFHRVFGSYLDPATYQAYGYLAYAVEHFFANGGSRCYVVRAADDTLAAAKAESKTTDTPAKYKYKFTAREKGTWGIGIAVTFTASSKASTKATDYGTEDHKTLIVASTQGFFEDDLVRCQQPSGWVYARVVSKDVDAKTITLDQVIELTPKQPVGTGYTPLLLQTCEFDVRISHKSDPSLTESYAYCNLNEESSQYVMMMLQRSLLIEFQTDLKQYTANTAVYQPPFQMITDQEMDDSNDKMNTVLVQLTGGSNGSTAPDQINPVIIGDRSDPPGSRRGIQAFLDIDDVNIMSVPGVTSLIVQEALIEHCENTKNRVTVLDVPQGYVKTQDVLNQYLNPLGSSAYAAVYHPWLQMLDPLTGLKAYYPPSGSVMGIYARTDRQRGVFKAPANEVVYNVLDLSVKYGEVEQSVLNPRGVNLIRAFPGSGIRVWGARTTSTNSLWKYINVRRLFIYLEQSVLQATNWVVFEPNTPQLWGRVQRTLEAFLTTVWRSGALVGSSPAAAFYVKIGADTMTTDDIDNGRLICEIGVAPVKPAEFVVFRFTQKTAQLD